MRGQAFYDASAQLIPLLWITVVVEYRLLHTSPLNATNKFGAAVLETFMALVALSFAVAEAQVLASLYAGRVRPGTDDSVKFALVAGAFALVAPIWARGEKRRADVGRRWRRAAVFGVAFGLLAVAYALSAVIGV